MTTLTMRPSVTPFASVCWTCRSRLDLPDPFCPGESIYRRHPATKGSGEAVVDDLRPLVEPAPKAGSHAD